MSPSCSQFLELKDNKFYYGDQHIFLSGVNIGWHDYGFDFGNGKYENSRPTLEYYIRRIHPAGGNSLRIWIHVEGDNTPQFSSDGYVTAPDSDGTMINELVEFVDYAAEYKVFVVPVLWNGAVMRNQNYIDMLYDDNKLTSYIDNALRPMVRALKDKPALGAWEIVNEPEGSILVESHANPCYNTTIIGEERLTLAKLHGENVIQVFQKNASEFQLTKPIVIGEFASDCGENEGIDYLWSHIYNGGYTGAWSWQYNEVGGCADSREKQDQGMLLLKGYTHNGVVIGPTSSSERSFVYGKVPMISLFLIFFYKKLN